MQNPFKFGGEVSGYQFYDRTEMVDTLQRRLTAGSSNIVIVAPRRYGKTSLMAKVLKILREKEGIRSLMFDLSMIPTLARFCEEYVNSVYAMAGGHQELSHRIMGWLASCNPSLTIGIGGMVKIKLNLRHVFSESSICEILNLPERIAEELETTFVVAFDEFQEVAEISREFALEKIFRGCIQHHKRVHYVFFGSKSHMLERMFHDHARPFYNSALTIPLGKPAIEDSREFVRSRFSDSGIYIGSEEIEAILDSSDNIPYYIQAISSFVFERVTNERRESVVVANVEGAVKDLVSLNASYYSTLMRGLSESQKTLVFALASEPTKEFGEEYRFRYDLPTSSTIHSALNELIRDAIVDEGDEPYRIADPLLVRYVLSSLGKVTA